MTVSRETLDDLATRYGLKRTAVDSLRQILAQLAAEPRPPTAVSDDRAAVAVHVADSLAGLEVEAIRRARAVADIGAGAGFPGLVLAAVLESCQFDLLEANHRKCEVIERLALAGGMHNTTARPVRAEEWAAYQGNTAYDAVLARAVSSLAVLVEYAAPLLVLGGALVAWKGTPNRGEERAGESAAKELGLALEAVMTVVPYATSRARRLYVYRKVMETPARFPRRIGVAAKRPLG